jgi:hypothetical protein
MQKSLLYLRIAWSVIWGVAAVLLIVLWVRSYSDLDSILTPGLLSQKNIEIDSSSGRIVFQLVPSAGWWSIARNRAIFEPGNGYRVPGEIGYFDGAGNSLQRNSIPTKGSFPHWFGVLIFASVAGSSWLPWWSKHFSLRTLLIATTLVAVALGLMVLAARN